MRSFLHKRTKDPQWHFSYYVSCLSDEQLEAAMEQIEANINRRGLQKWTLSTWQAVKSERFRRNRAGTWHR